MANKYRPAVGDHLRLSSSDSRSFAGPFKATVVDIVKLTNGRTGLIVETHPPAYFGADPLAMRESDKFLLVARAGDESLAEIPAGEEVSVHIAECSDWQSVHGNNVEPNLFKVLAWGEVTYPFGRHD